MKYFNIAPTASEQAVNLHNQKAATKRATGEEDAFAMIMSAKVQKALESVKPSEGQSLSAYKDEIYQRISEITVHPTQRDTGYSVHITEAGFRRMQRDPDYEQFVMGKIAEYMQTPYNTAADAPTFVMLYFDDTEDEHSAYLQGGIDQEYTYEENKYSESFWDSRTRRHEENMEASERLAAKRREQEEYFERKHLAEESLKEELLARAVARRKSEPYTDTSNRIIMGTPASTVAGIVAGE